MFVSYTNMYLKMLRQKGHLSRVYLAKCVSFLNVQQTLLHVLPRCTSHTVTRHTTVHVTYLLSISIRWGFLSRNCWNQEMNTSASSTNNLRLSSRLATTAHQPWCCRCCWCTKRLHNDSRSSLSSFSSYRSIHAGSLCAAGYRNRPWQQTIAKNLSNRFQQQSIGVVRNLNLPMPAAFWLTGSPM